MASKDKDQPKIEIFYHVGDGGYWYKLRGRFVPLKKSDLCLHLRKLGLRDDIYEDGLREIDAPFFHAMTDNLVDYAGVLAGHRVGIFTDSSKRKFLVTGEASGVFDDIPKKMPLPKFFLAFIQELLTGDARALHRPGQPAMVIEQWLHFCHWLAIALRSLKRGDFRPGQVSVIAGPAQCGKSLLQLIISEVLGGRMANPEKYMMGEKFSADLAGAEHWQIEDPDSTTDVRTRRSFGNRLKECANNENFYIRKMNKDPISLPIFRRISLTVNDERESLAIVPPMEESIRDKINLYKCARVTEALKQFICDTPALPALGNMVQENVGDLDRRRIKKAIADELQQIRSWLLRLPPVPEELRDNRFGIVSAHHVELMQELDELAPETRFLDLIDQALFCCRPGEVPSKIMVEGLIDQKHFDVEQLLRKSDLVFEVEKCLRYIGACGSYLGKLSKSQPDRVSKRVTHGRVSLWTIKPPTKIEGENE